MSSIVRRTILYTYSQASHGIDGTSMTLQSCVEVIRIRVIGWQTPGCFPIHFLRHDHPLA